MAVFGELGGLIYSMGNKKLEDLDFSEYNQLFNASNIVSSWDNVPGSGVYFPLIDYGTYSTDKKNWQINTFRPSLYVKEYLDKMFAASGYSFSSSLFSSARFKNLVVPHSQKVLQALSSVACSAKLLAPVDVLDHDAYIANNDLVWDSISAGIFNILAGFGFQYLGATPLSVNLNWEIHGWRKSTVSNFKVSVQLNGVDVPGTIVTYSASHGSSIPYFWSGTKTLVLNTNDTISFHYYTHDTDAVYTISAGETSSMSISTTTPQLVPISIGDTIKMNDAIPKNILQIDFFASLIKLFNLYVYEDKYYPNHLYIEPYINYYDGNPLNGKDWTQKIDRGQPMRIKPMSEMNSRIYKFNFKDDSDYYNDLYKKRYNISYGSYLYDSEFEFNNDEATADLIFSGTPLVGYGGEAKVYSTIFKRTGTATLVEETIDSNIRILQTKKVSGVPSWNILNGSTVLGSYTSYGYAGHLDDPDAPANDIQFGVPNELFFTLAAGALNVNQFNVYWSPYMAEITDKDSKLLTAYIRLSTKDINLLDFSKLIFIDGSCFRINKIIDYNATVEDLCQVELLKVIDTASTTIVPIEDIGDNVLTYIGDGTEGYTVIIPGLLGKNIVLMIQGTNICALAAIPNPGEYNITGTSITFGAPIQEGQLIQILFN